MFANAHFRGKDDIAFLPEDFLGTGNRQKRQAEALADRLLAAKANAALQKMKRGDEDGVPDWAKGEYQERLSDGQ